MLKFSPYSFSRINTFDSCPRKFKYSYILKLPRGKTDQTALLKGSALHNILEHYPNPATHKLAPKYQHIIDKFLGGKYAHYLHRKGIKEMGIGLTEKLEPCEYSKSAMFRGYIDYFTIIDGIMYIADWKSGKLVEPRWQNFNQLLFYSIYMFKKYSKLDKIIISYIYIEHESDNSIMLERKYLDNYSRTLLESIRDVELSDYPKCETKLCEWCDYQEYCKTDIDK